MGDDRIEGAAGMHVGGDLDARAGQLAPMLGDGDVRVRKSAVVALGKMPCTTAVELLCRALDDAETGVGVLACQALGRLADPACLEVVLSHAHDADPQMRAGVLWVLANVAAHGGLDDAARSELFAPIVLLAFDPDDGVRADAAAVLGTVPDERCVAPLLVLAEDDDPRTRANACASLGLVGGVQGEEALLGILDEDGVAPLVAVSALDALARRAERGELGRNGGVAPEAGAADDAEKTGDSFGTDGASGEGAAMSAVQRAVGAALRLAGDAADADVRSTAIWSLGLLVPQCPSRADEAVDLLGTIMGDEPAGGDDAFTWQLRYAAEALARIGGPAARSVLEKANGQAASGELACDPQTASVLTQALAAVDA